MSDVKTLREAVARRDAIRAHAKELAEKLAGLQAQDLAITDEVVTARAALDEQLALDVLGEPHDVPGATARHTQAVERMRGVDRASSITQDRILAAGKDYDAADRCVAEAMAELARPMIEGCRIEVLAHAEALGRSYRLLMQLDQASRLRGGHLTGDAAHVELAGAPGRILERFGFACQNDGIFPRLRERTDDLTHEQLIALLSL